MLTRKRLIKLARWLISLLVVATLFYFVENEGVEEIRAGEAPVLYANQCHDDLEQMYAQAITDANQSILLIIYSLTDTRLIKALNQKAHDGIKVKVIYDAKTSPYGFKKLSSKVEKQPVKVSGLMHQKILVVDHEKIWVGSANMTPQSLKLHDNLVEGLIDQKLADVIHRQLPFSKRTIGEQQVEYWSLPKKGKEGLDRLTQLIDKSKSSIRVAMFTWTHPALTKAILRAHSRGVHVQIVLDRDQSIGVSDKALDMLHKAGVDVRVSTGLGMLHHKFAWIDDEILVNGSANWTRSAFTRNWDCFLVLYPLTPTQKKKLEELWHATISLSDKNTYKLAA